MMRPRSAIFSVIKNISMLQLVLLLSFSQLLPAKAYALTLAEERMIGEYLLYSLRQQLRILDEPDIHQYINRLGHSVLKVAGQQYFDYHFFVVQSNQFNAFAAPGGLVFFYSELVAAMHNEDELVSVLAHEIGHITSRHIAQRMDKGSKVSTLALIFAVAGMAMGVPGLSEGLMTGSLAAGQSANLQYSREHEEQSDRLAFAWMQRLQRDPAAMIEMLRTMRRITRYNIGGNVPQYLLTHPQPEARLSYVQSLIEISSQAGKHPVYAQIDNFDFLRFQYRVMMLSIDPGDLRVRCLNTIKSQNASKEQKIMARFGLALLASDERKPDQALVYLDEVQKEYPNRPILAIDRAAILLENGRFDESATLLEQAYERDANDMYGVYQLARLEMMRGKSKRAEELLQRVARAMPEFPQVYFDLGKLASDRKDDASSLFYLGKYNLYRGRLDAARQYLTRAMKNSKMADSHRREAEAILARLEEMKKAL